MKRRRPETGSIEKAAFELNEELNRLKKSEPGAVVRRSHLPFQPERFSELLLFLDSESPQLLDRTLRKEFQSFTRRLCLATSLATSLAEACEAGAKGTDIKIDIAILYRVFTGHFPDQDGASFYEIQLAEKNLSIPDLMHILAASRTFRLLGDCLFSPTLLFHFPAALRAKVSFRLRRYGRKRSIQPDGRRKNQNDRQPADVVVKDFGSGHEQNPAAIPDLIETGKRKPEARPRIAVIVHRAGPDFSGGAERHAMIYARYLSEIADTQILTTCAKDYLTWKNEYPPGLSVEEDIPVRRFPVSRERNPSRFHRLSAILRFLIERLPDSGPGKPVLELLLLPLSFLWMKEQGPRCNSLLRYLKSHQNDYDFFLFFTYLYEPTFSGLPLVARKAALVPTAHPEWPLLLPIWKGFFAKVGRVIYNTEEERRFLRERFPAVPDGPVLGCGVDIERPSLDRGRRSGAGQPRRKDSFRERSGIVGPFLLYTGRVDPEKGCRRLTGLFLRYLRETESPLHLVLIGSKAMYIPDHPRIHAPGFVSREVLESALCECAVYVHPSPLESLSFSLLEAMLAGRPVLATAESDVLRGHVLRGHAGLCYGNGDDFFSKLDTLLKTPERFTGGPAYVRKRYSHAAVKGSLNRWIMAEIQKLQGSSGSLPDPRNGASLSR